MSIERQPRHNRNTSLLTFHEGEHVTAGRGVHLVERAGRTAILRCRNRQAYWPTWQTTTDDITCWYCNNGRRSDMRRAAAPPKPPTRIEQRAQERGEREINAFGACLAAHRKAMGILQQDFAARIGRTATNLSGLEHGHRSVHLDTAELILRELGVLPHIFFAAPGAPEGTPWDYDLVDFPRLLYYRTGERGMLYRDVCQRADVDMSTITRIVSGAQIPTLATTHRIIEAGLGMTLRSYLARLTGGPPSRLGYIQSLERKGTKHRVPLLPMRDELRRKKLGLPGVPEPTVPYVHPPKPEPHDM